MTDSHKKLDSFTMIELVFIIVILGVLASIAIPRLATSRDDAIAVAIKSDIGTILQAVLRSILVLAMVFAQSTKQRKSIRVGGLIMAQALLAHLQTLQTHHAHKLPTQPHLPTTPQQRLERVIKS